MLTHRDGYISDGDSQDRYRRSEAFHNGRIRQLGYNYDAAPFHAPPIPPSTPAEREARRKAFYARLRANLKR